jgi:hypothetical protein
VAINEDLIGWSVEIDAATETPIRDDEVDQLVDALRRTGGTVALGSRVRLNVQFAIAARTMPTGAGIEPVVRNAIQLFRRRFQAIDRHDWTINGICVRSLPDDI